MGSLAERLWAEEEEAKRTAEAVDLRMVSTVPGKKSFSTPKRCTDRVRTCFRRHCRLGFLPIKQSWSSCVRGEEIGSREDISLWLTCCSCSAGSVSGLGEPREAGSPVSERSVFAPRGLSSVRRGFAGVASQSCSWYDGRRGFHTMLSGSRINRFLFLIHQVLG